MTPEQAKKLVQLAFYEQGLANDMVKNVDSDLKATLRIIAGEIRALPEPGDLMRESRWRAIKPRIMAQLERFSGRFGESVISVLRDGAVKAEEFSRGYIELGVEGATQSGQVVRANSSVTVGINQPPQMMFINNQEIPVTTGRIYFKAIAETDVVGQSFTKLFGKSISEQGGILTVGQQKTGFARFFMTSIDRMVTEGILKGEATEEIAQNLIFESVRNGLNLGKTAKQLKTQAMTVARTATANALNRAHAAFWDANNSWEWTDEDGNRRSGKLIVGYVFDAVTDSRACPECAMYDQQFREKRDQLPVAPLHPRCRCVRRPITRTERALMTKERRSGQVDGGSGIQLYQASELPGRRKGESPKDFIKRQRRLRQAQIQQGKDTKERWYATPVKKDGKTYYRVARDMPATDGSGVRRVPEWLAKTNKTTQVDFFGGPRRAGSDVPSPGEIRQAEFQRLIKGGDHPREALNKLLNVDREDGLKRYRFKASSALAAAAS